MMKIGYRISLLVNSLTEERETLVIYNQSIAIGILEHATRDYLFPVLTTFEYESDENN